jgi:SAM-dependent methyltransferase
MSASRPSGTEGYFDDVEALVRQYESIPFAETHKVNMHLIPKSPVRALDIGAGTGRDAAGLAAMGHSVVAVEPVSELRLRGTVLHPSPRIEWLDDSLPDLLIVSGRGETFDLVMLTAVWMHLDGQERRRAMPRLAALVRPGGLIILSVRHGPVPAGRRMFDVPPTETVGLAQAEGMTCVQRLEGISDLRNRSDVSWDRFAFAKPGVAR